MRPPNAKADLTYIKADLTAWAHKLGAVANAEFMGTWGLGIELSSESCLTAVRPTSCVRQSTKLQSTKLDFVEYPIAP